LEVAAPFFLVWAAAGLRADAPIPPPDDSRAAHSAAPLPGVPEALGDDSRAAHSAVPLPGVPEALRDDSRAAQQAGTPVDGTPVGPAEPVGDKPAAVQACSLARARASEMAVARRASPALHSGADSAQPEA